MLENGSITPQPQIKHQPPSNKYVTYMYLCVCVVTFTIFHKQPLPS